MLNLASRQKVVTTLPELLRKEQIKCCEFVRFPRCHDSSSGSCQMQIQIQIQMPKQTQTQIQIVRHVASGSAGARCPFVLPGSCNYLFIMHAHTHRQRVYVSIYTHTLMCAHIPLIPCIIPCQNTFCFYLFHTINYTYLFHHTLMS